MPESTFIHREAKSMAGFKAFKDRITVLLGGNVAGYKLKRFLIWHNENPKVFKHINKRTLPVHCRSTKKSWVAQLLFQDVHLHCYDSEIEKYYLVSNISFKILHFLIQERGVAYWLRHCATSRTVSGTIPGGVTGDFFRGSPRQTMCPGVDSASENEYQGFLLG
jgi:hypothetical protein